MYDLFATALNQFANRPLAGLNPRRSAWGHPDRQVRFAEAAINEIEGDRSLEIVQFLAESMPQPSQAAAVHSQGAVLFLDMRSRNQRVDRRSLDDLQLGLDDLCRATPSGRVLVQVTDGVGFYELRVVHFQTKPALNGVRIGRKLVRGNLNPIAHAGSQVVNKGVGVVGIALPGQEGRNQLRIGIQGDERPDIPGPGIALLGRGVLVLLGDEAPNLVDLDAAGNDVAHLLVVEGGAGFANPTAQAHDLITVNARNPLNGANGRTLGEIGNDLDFLFGWKLVGHIVFNVD